MATPTINQSIKKIHVTEKASALSENGVYTFIVQKTATKDQVAKNVKELYKVTPVKVRIVISKPKNVNVRGKTGRTRSFKKAYVYLKKGDTIDIA